MRGISPLRILAVKKFKERYLSLFSVSAELSSFERTLIEHNEEFKWIDNFSNDDKKEIEQTAIAANHFLVKGTLKKHQIVAESALNIANYIVPAFNRCVSIRGKIKELEFADYDNKIELNLKFYKTIYEALLPIILSPIVYAFSIHNDIKDKDFIPNEDGKIKLRVLKKMEKWLISPQNRLAVGLNSHLRNAYAHESYRILDHGKVELWDRNPNNPDKMWGPEIWEIDKLEELCQSLWVNCFGIIEGLLIFIINNRKLARNSNWAQPKPLNIKLRRDEFTFTVQHICEELSFKLIFCNNENGCIIKLTTQPKGVDQDEGIMLQYEDGSAQHYKVPVKYEERLIIKQLYSLLDYLSSYFGKEDKFEVEVENYDKTIIGSVEGYFNNVLKFMEGNILLTEIFDENRIGEQKMYVRVQKPLHLK